jgi:hypothetical protein
MKFWTNIKQYYKLFFVILLLVLLLYSRILRPINIKYLDLLNAYDKQLYFFLRFLSLILIVYQFLKLTTNISGIPLSFLQFFRNGLFELDNYLKSKPYLKPYRISFIEFIIKYMDKNVFVVKVIYFLLDLLPRYIVACFLFYDIFYNNRIQYFYKSLPLLFIPLILLFIEVTITNEFLQGCKKIESKILIQINTNGTYKKTMPINDYVHLEVVAELSGHSVNATITPSYDLIKSTPNFKRVNWDKTLLKFKSYITLLCRTHKVLYI